MPAQVRKKLGVGPGSVLEWEEEGGKIVVRRAGEYTFDDIHRIAFPDGPPKRRSLRELKKALGDAIAEHYARSR